jgi:hypothetical protein
MQQNHSAHIDLDMKSIVNAKFGTHAPRNDIQVLEALDDRAQRAWVGVSDHSKSKEGEGLLGTHGTNSASFLP